MSSGLKLKFHRTDTDTDTDFRDAPISCNFVNLYTIVYHVQYTYTCKRAHPQRTSSQGKARVGQKSARQVGRGCPARGELNEPRAPRQSACRKSVSVSASVSVSVLWNLAISEVR